MGPTNLANRVREAFVDAFNRGFDAGLIGLHRTGTPGFAVDGPRLKLMREGCRMRAKHHTNVKFHRRSNLRSHGHRVGIGGAMAIEIDWGCSEIRAMDEHEVGAACSLEILRSIEKATCSVQVKMVVRDGAVVRHAQPSIANARLDSICVRQ
jgi:hypothetical protein